MRFLIMLEQTEAGFAVQVPDLAIMTFGADIEAAQDAAREAIHINRGFTVRPDKPCLMRNRLRCTLSAACASRVLRRQASRQLCRHIFPRYTTPMEQPGEAG
jgi:hypothetical protein